MAVRVRAWGRAGEVVTALASMCMLWCIAASLNMSEQLSSRGTQHECSVCSSTGLQPSACLTPLPELLHVATSDGALAADVVAIKRDAVKAALLGHLAAQLQVLAHQRATKHLQQVTASVEMPAWRTPLSATM